MAATLEDHSAPNVPSQDLNGPTIAGGIDLAEKYSTERQKRLREDGGSQFIDLIQTSKYRYFLDDPWVSSSEPHVSPINDGGHTRFLIAGAGFGGVQFAVKLIQSGFSASDIIIVDSAGGFGGTWYWNRYPGLMCDVESYIYLPLLEEMGYMPKRKYASGEEIRLYIESICTKYGLQQRALFQSTIKTMRWDDSVSEWVIEFLVNPKGGSQRSMTVRADYTFLASGVLNNPKLPGLPGLDAFQGRCFHTSRWDYQTTGGDPANPDLTELQGKQVGIIGTGATAVQSVPYLAKFAEKLYVFQRTPSSVDSRDNRDTSEAEWHDKIATGEGWWRKRNANFNAFVNNAAKKPDVNFVDDNWTKMNSYCALIGSAGKAVTMENVSEHVTGLHAADGKRSDRVRARVEQIVEDKETAEKLKAWYPGWCKRPCFHDEYLQSFNRPNVTLVDTDGRGVDELRRDSVIVAGKEYPVDVLIFSTGFRSPVQGSAADKADITVFGREGLPLSQRFGEGLTTLHGVVSRSFPNMFWPGPTQAAATSNQSFVLDQLSAHVAYLIREGEKKAQGSKVTIEPTAEGAEAWAMRIMSGAIAFAALSGCTPSYFNAEGATDKITKPEDQMKAAKSAIWGGGIEEYLTIIEDWRRNGRMEGLEITAVG